MVFNRHSKHVGVVLNSNSQIKRCPVTARKPLPRATPPRFLTVAERQRVVDLYNDRVSSNAISVRFGCSPAMVLKVLHASGVVMRSLSETQRRSTVDESRFLNWDTEDLYWAGFLVADGSLSRSRGYGITLVQSSRDASHIERFRSFMGTSRKIITVPSPGSKNRKATITRLNFNSQAIHSRLVAAGIRSRNGSFVVPELATSHHFWRGVIDGDGHVAHCGPHRLELVGGRDLLGQFCEFALSVDSGFASHVRPHKSIWRVVTQGRVASALLARLYPVGCLSLERKYAAATRPVTSS